MSTKLIIMIVIALILILIGVPIILTALGFAGWSVWDWFGSQEVDVVSDVSDVDTTSKSTKTKPLSNLTKSQAIEKYGSLIGGKVTKDEADVHYNADGTPVTAKGGGVIDFGKYTGSSNYTNDQPVVGADPAINADGTVATGSKGGVIDVNKFKNKASQKKTYNEVGYHNDNSITTNDFIKT